MLNPLGNARCRPSVTNPPHSPAYLAYQRHAASVSAMQKGKPPHLLTAMDLVRHRGVEFG